MITNNTGGTISSKNGYGIDGFAWPTPRLAMRLQRAWRPCDGHHHDHQLCPDHEPVGWHPRCREGLCGRLWLVHRGFRHESGRLRHRRHGGCGTVITNNVGGTIVSKTGKGIDGYSRADAIAEGFKAFGGTASATTTITNFAAITSWDDGIYGGAKVQRQRLCA